MCLVGTGNDRQDASCGIDVTSIVKCSCLFSFHLIFSFGQFPSERREQRGQAWPLPRSLALTLSVLRGSEEASDLDW